MSEVSGKVSLPVLSYSKVSSYKRCPKCYKLGYIDKLPKVEKPYTVLGNFCHSVLEAFHKHWMQTPVDKDKFKTVMRDSFALQREKYKERIQKEQVDDAYGMMKTYLEHISDPKTIFPNIVSLEQKIWETVNDEFIFLGYIDRVQFDKEDNVFHIVDYKTTQKKQYLKDDTQIKLYGHFIALNNPEIENIRVSYILLKHKMQYMTKEYNVSALAEAKDHFVEQWHELKNDQLFRANAGFGSCTICDYVDICQEGRDLIHRKKSYFGETDW